MTPKEKALELYNKFRNEIPVVSANVRGKRIALICVSEILKVNPQSDQEYSTVSFWQEVKHEIDLI